MYKGLVFKKIDRILCNQEWLRVFEDFYGVFEAGGCSDHLRARINVVATCTRRRLPFKFMDALVQHPHFMGMVKEYWEETVPLFASTTATYIFTKKLKAMKSYIRQLGREYIGHIQQRAQDAYEKLCRAQETNNYSHTDQSLEAELSAQQAWKAVSHIEEQYLRQKSKIHWLKVGDKNNAFFQKIAKHRQLRNMVKELKDSNGNKLTNSQEIKNEAARYYEEFLTETHTDLMTNSMPSIANLDRFQCNDEDKISLMSPITDEEIKETLFRMPKNKSPGPDGFTLEFYIATWPILGKDFTTAIHSFFQFGFLPGVNSTILALIPKKEKVEEMCEFLKFLFNLQTCRKRNQILDVS